MFFSSKNISPASARSAPEIWPTRVVLPAPFGPISACTSPARTSSVTASVATTPPKCLLTLSRRSMFPVQEAGDALRGEEHDDEEHDADAEAGVLLVVRRDRGQPVDAVVGDEVLEEQQHRRADHPAPQ